MLCRTFDNNSLFTLKEDNHEYWGKCKPECAGEMPSPESKYNLAQDDDSYNSAWSYGRYDLLKFGGGFCFTYDPPKKSGSGVSNGLYFMLGHEQLFKKYPADNIQRMASKDSSYMTNTFDVYLHEKVRLIYFYGFKF